jgi:hypothetical protein
MKGVVLTHLPKTSDSRQIVKRIAETLGVSDKNATIYKNWVGQPAYALVSYNEMPKLDSHKLLVDNHKIYVKVSSI